MAEFRMPSLGADMEAGTLIAWHVAVGDRVAKGDIVAEVDTDKSVIDVETFATGTVDQLLVAEGGRVPVGTPLAIIQEDERAEAADTARSPAPTPTTRAVAPSTIAPPAVAPTVPPATREPASPRPARRPPASPLARRHAQALDVDLADVTGTGPDGVVTTRDVERFAAERVKPPVPAAPSGPARQAGLRRAIAAAMTRSNREIPHYYLSSDLDVTDVVRWLEARNAALPVTERLLPAAVLLKATAVALRETPDLNGFWTADQFEPSPRIHLGVAIALRGGGLMAPAIHDADHLSLAELMAHLRDLVGRARSGGLRSSEMSDPTITVTNLGDQGVDVVLPVIYPPQVAIVGFGQIKDRPWVTDGALGIKPLVTATLAADHRVSDGHRGALFLTALDRLLHRPEDL